MTDLVIDQQDTSVAVERQSLVLRHSEWPRPKSIPLRQIDSLVIQSRISLDSSIFSQLAAHRIRVQIIPARGQGEACYLVGTQHKDAQRRLNHYAHAQNDASKMDWARRIVRLKLRQQRLFLHYAADIRPALAPQFALTMQHIRNIDQRLHQHRSFDALRGAEGAATAAYFAAYQQLFADSLAFSGRNRRPPRDPVNVVLSLSYTLMHSIFAQAVHVAGLDPQLGALHEVAYGRDSLVCDLMELKRAEIERWVWRLFADGVLRPEDFHMTDAVGHLPCTLGKAGRGRFYAEFASIQRQLTQQARKIVWVLVHRLNPQLAQVAEDPDTAQDDDLGQEDES